MTATDRAGRPERGSSGSPRITRCGSDVLLFKVSGHLSTEHAEMMIKKAESLLAEQGEIHALHDWEKVTSYSWQAKVLLTKFVFMNRRRFLSAHLLVSAPDVAFGVEVANIVLKNKITVHRERSSFEGVLKRILDH